MGRWSLLLLLLGGSVGDEAGIDVVIEATAADVYYALPYALFALRRRGRGFVGSITVSYAAAERRDFAKLEKVFPASPGNGTRRDVVFTSAGAPGGARLAADAVAFRRVDAASWAAGNGTFLRAPDDGTGALRAALRCVALEDADFGDAAKALRRCADLARRSRRAAAARRGLCLDGRLAPEHFVIGAQKAGTTTFASALAAQPSIVLPEGASAGARKEPHVFDGPVLREEWLRRYPACDRKAGAADVAAAVAAARANGGLATVELRPEAAARRVGLDATPVLYVDAAPKIVAQYGALAPRLSFTVLLRDPVGRTASAFHNWVRAGWRREKSKADRVETLEQYVAYLAKRGGRDPFSRVPGGVGRLFRARGGREPRRSGGPSRGPNTRTTCARGSPRSRRPSSPSCPSATSTTTRPGARSFPGRESGRSGLRRRRSRRATRPTSRRSTSRCGASGCRSRRPGPSTASP